MATPLTKLIKFIFMAYVELEINKLSLVTIPKNKP